MTAAVDKGKLIWARHPGDCAECGGSIMPGQPIYFSRQMGSRHRRCVDGDDDDARQPVASRAETPCDAAPRATPRDDGFLFGDGHGDGRRHDDAPRAARDGGQPSAASDDDGYRAPLRETAFGRAGDRDAARRELGEVLDLVIDAQQKFTEALVRIRKLLA